MAKRHKSKKSISQLAAARARRRQRTSTLSLETLEERHLLAGDFQLAAIQASDGTLISAATVRTVDPGELTLIFSKGQTIDPSTLGSISVVRSGGDAIFDNGNDVPVTTGFIGVGEEPNEVVLRFAEGLPDDNYRLTVAGTLSTIDDTPFNEGDAVSTRFELDLGAQVIAVVPQPIRESGGARVAARNQIDVYFNDDNLDQALAQNPAFYQLIYTNDTVTSADDGDPILPTSVSYDPSTDKAVLTFAADIEDLTSGAGTYRLRIGDNATAPPAPQQVPAATDPGATTADASTALGTLTNQPLVVSEAINPQAAGFALEFPGSEDDPGHRLVTSFDSHVQFEDTAPNTIETVEYNFRSVYGRDSLGNPVINQITAAQKQRAREVFEIYSSYLGIQFVETADAGITVATGDLRPVGGRYSAGFEFNSLGAAGQSTILVDDEPVSIDVAVMNSAQQWDTSFGETWFRQAMREIGHVIGFGETQDLPEGTMFGGDPRLTLGAAAEDVFPGANDIIHGQFLYHPNSDDVDLYRFEVTESGTVTAETFAQRLEGASSSLDTVLRLFQDGPQGLVNVAQNDDYYGNDSFLQFELAPGTYYIGVSSTGNDAYSPLYESGAGGTSQGDYDLRMTFRSTSANSLADTTGRRLDGDADGREGGNYNFWFRAQDESHTIYVAKDTVGQGDGTLASPYSNLQVAMNAAQPGDIVRVLGNRTDTNPLNDIPYQIGFNNLDQPLPDGAADGTLKIKQDVVMMIDGGALFKMRRGAILAGSDSSVVDRSGGSIQVLGTPVSHVLFTSINDETIGVDVDPLSLAPRRGDWGGIRIRRDVDNAAGLTNYENEGIFLDYVNHAEMRYGGGVLALDSVSQAVNPISMVDARPTISHNFLNFNADAALSANPNSFRETNFRSPEFQSIPFTPDYARVGPDIHNNRLVNNTTNGLFVVDRSGLSSSALQMTTAGRWDDTDIVHVVADTLVVAGNPGGPVRDADGTITAREAGRLRVDPGVVVKLDGGRVEVGIGASFIAEGTASSPIVFTSLLDDRYGAGGTFDSNNDTMADVAHAEDWGGIMARATSIASLDHTILAYGGGTGPIEGGFAGFNVIETHQGRLRLTNSVLENNGSGTGAAITTTRVGRGENQAATVYVRGAQPVILGNVFRDNTAAVASIDVNSLDYESVIDTGRATGVRDASQQYLDNQGPLIRNNVIDNNGVNGMLVRGGTLSTEGVWDDTDIVHVIRDAIYVPNHHTFGGLRLKSSPSQSLVVKALGKTAGIVTTGTAIGIPDHIGGSLQIQGQPGNPVIMTSFYDDTVGAGLNQEGQTQVDTDGGGRPVRTESAGEEGSFRIDLNFGPAIRQFPEVMKAARLAADIWEENLQDNVRIVLDIDLVDQGAPGLSDSFAGGGVLSGINANNFNLDLFNTTPVFGTVSYASVRSSLISDAGAHESLLQSLPTANDLNVQFPQNSAVPFVVSDNMLLTRANAAALGLGTGSFVTVPSAYNEEENAIDGTILINDNLDLFDFDRTDGLKVYREDFQTQMLAQIGEILGFETSLNTVIANLQNPPTDGTEIEVPLTPLDLFRFAPGAGGEDFANSPRLLDPQLGEHVFYAGGDFDYRGYPFEGISIGDIPIGTGYDAGRGSDELNDIFANRWRDDHFFRDGERLDFDTIGVMDQASLLRDEILQTNDSTVYTQGMIIDISEADRMAFDAIGYDVVGGTPGDWAGIRIEELSYDGNVEYVTEGEQDLEINSLPASAQTLGTLAPDRNAGNENLRLGFEVHGALSKNTDVDVYSFRAEAGTEVWVDIDQTSSTLDTVVELIASNGAVLAGSDNSVAETSNPGLLVGAAEALAPTDLFTVNDLDAGMKVTLPGPAGLESTYFVRVSSHNSNSQGRYELQLRLRERDEVPGTAIQFASINYADTGVKIVGPPSDSPLVGEQSEDESLNDYFTEYTVASVGDDEDLTNRYVTIDKTVANAALPYEVSAQPLGNLSATRQGAVSVFGTLDSGIFGGDVDWYRFDILPTDRGSTLHNVVFDIDFADGIGGPDTVLAVYRNSASVLTDDAITANNVRLFSDLTPELIYYGESSNVAADRVLTVGSTETLTGGSFGSEDPFIGPVAMTAGTYFIAVSSANQIPGLVADARSEGNDIFVDAVPGDPNRGLAIDPAADFQYTVPGHVTNPDFPFGAITEGEYQLEIRFAPTNPGASSVSTDQNRERIQGQLIISNNQILNSRKFGVSVEDGARDQLEYGGALDEVDFTNPNFARDSSFSRPHGQFNNAEFTPTSGVPRALPGLNEERVVPGITISNNVIAGGFDGAISMQGDPNGILLDVYDLNVLFAADSQDNDDFEPDDLNRTQFTLWDYQGKSQTFQFTLDGNTDPDKIPIRFDGDATNDPLFVSNELFNTNINPPTLAVFLAQEIAHAIRVSDLDVKVYTSSRGGTRSETFQTSEDDTETITYGLSEALFIEGAAKIGMPDVIADTIRFAFSPDNARVGGGNNVPPITAQIVQQGAVPYARIVNNTLVGRGGDLFGNGVGDVGVVIEDNASPTLLNNIVSNFDVGIRADFSANDSNADRRTFVGTQDSVPQFSFDNYLIVERDVENLDIANYGVNYNGVVFSPNNPDDFLDGPLLHRDVDRSGTDYLGQRPTIVGATIYQGNNNNGLRINAGDFAISLADSAPLFVDGAAGNYFLAQGSRAIDSSLDFLAEREYLADVLESAGIETASIDAPNIDAIGILRVDDPNVEPPNGLGSNVFKDRGALERADFVGPTATLTDPLDNDAQGIDQDAGLNSVAVLGEILTRFEIRLTDGASLANPTFGSGVDDGTINSEAIIVRRDEQVLVEGTDYFLTYDQTNDRLRIIPVAGIWTGGSTYEVELVGGPDGIRDRANNPLRPNRADGSTQFVISINAGLDYGDAPTPYPSLKSDDGASHAFVDGYQLGGFITVEADATINGTATGDFGDDGVELPASLLRGGDASITVTATGEGRLSGWVDWNGDGDWNDVGEQIFNGTLVVAGANVLNGIDVPGDAVLGTTFARFRFSSVPVASPTGAAIDGEVEDYAITIGENPWRNPDNPFDVDANGVVAPVDALLVINELNVPLVSNPDNGVLPATPPAGFAPPFIDVNGDGFVSPLDALLVINQLNNPTAALSASAGRGDGVGNDLQDERDVAAGPRAALSSAVELAFSGFAGSQDDLLDGQLLDALAISRRMRA